MRTLNEFHLRLLETDYLVELREAIKEELARRRKASAVAARRHFISQLTPHDFSERDAFNAAALQENSSNLLAVRGLTEEPDKRKHYLSALLAQDWSSIYSGGDPEPKYYVYAHVDPRERIFVARLECGGNYGGRPFYIGKGTGDRAYDLKRNQGHGKVIRSILECGYEASDIVKLVFDGLPEAKAFEIEAKLIYFFGTIYQEHRAHACLYNLDIPPTPEFVGTMTKYVTRREYSKNYAPAVADVEGAYAP